MKNLLTLALVCAAFMLCAQPSDSNTSEEEKTYQRRIYNTQHIEAEEAPRLDGILDDAIWDRVPWGEEFTVSNPNNGEVPQRSTKFKILYDTKNLYVAYRAYHEDPDKIENRLSRRDNFPGDWVEINIDSYFDHNTAFSFTTSVSGVKGDEFVTGNGNNWDTNWNPIWYAKTNIDDEGWTAEIKIPMSQLRFGDKEEHVWGFQIMRRDFGSDERSTWQWVPPNVPGWVSNFAELHGISGIKPAKQLEIQPFAVANHHVFEKEEGNPFADGSKTTFNFGVDGKYALTSDLTLDFTINPDFGQVEADPSRVTLDGFQIFFGERRPFFVENANLFEFPVSQLEAGGSFGNDNLFYSRRIGAQPSGFINNPSEAFVSRPTFTTIIGAAKVSGKTKDGWGISFLESVTAEETATVTNNGVEETNIIEPLTNYFVAGISKDFFEGGSRISAKLTGVNRRLGGTGLEDQFHSQAITGGLDFWHTWKGREWQIRANYIFSNVEGTAQKILDTQTGFEHYYQRPDAEHLDINESLTNLTGNGGTFSIANYGGADNISFQTGVTYRSPGLDLNDIGFLNTADEINHVTWAGYRFPKPFSIFRSFRINLNHYQRWTSGGEYLYNAANTNVHASFKNYMRFSIGTTLEMYDVSQKALFGGPLLRRSPSTFTWMNFNSDSRKKVTYGFNFSGGKSIWQDDGAVEVISGGVWAGAQISDRLRFSINPSYFLSTRVLQNVSSANFNGDPRYIIGTVRQETFSISMRINLSITPNMTFQYWGQPFVSKGTYKDFKYITDPLAKVYTDRFDLYNENQISYSDLEDSFSIDEDGNGIVDYSFGNPDFNFLQWRSNLVFRWEYNPNSEFFLVWQQSTTNFGDPTKGIFPSLNDDLFGSSFDNFFVMKLTYRFFNK